MINSSQLKAWYQALPPVLHKKTSVENPHVIVLHVVHSWYVIRLHHASVGKDDESRKVCVRLYLTWHIG